MNRICKVEKCNKKCIARGFCRLHYNRWYFGILDEDGKQLREIFSTKPCGESWKRKMKEVMNCPKVKKKCGWSKGLTKETDERVKRQGNFRKGLAPRNKGLTLEEEFGVEKAKEIKQQISSSMKKAFENDPTLREKCRFWKGKITAMKGKQHSPETREKIKKTLAALDPEVKRRKIEAISGEKNHNWRGGISHKPYGYKFNSKLKKKILARDGNVCQLCFMLNEEHKENFGDSLHCHHIDYDKQNCKENNLITLCNKCNADVNFNRKRWTNYFQILLSVVDEQIYLMELC